MKPFKNHAILSTIIAGTIFGFWQESATAGITMYTFLYSLYAIYSSK